MFEGMSDEEKKSIAHLSIKLTVLTDENQTLQKKVSQLEENRREMETVVEKLKGECLKYQTEVRTLEKHHSASENRLSKSLFRYK